MADREDHWQFRHHEVAEGEVWLNGIAIAPVLA
jgi:hypothetical protein